MRTTQKHTRTAGFTIVELLIVIVVIGILAAIVIVAYNGVQARAMDSQQIGTVNVLKKSLATYYIDHGFYPPDNSFGNSLANDNDGTWALTNMTGLSASALLAPKTPSGVKNGILRQYSASLPKNGTYIGYISRDINGNATQANPQQYVLTYYSFTSNNLIVEIINPAS
jgi:general secretion pathway protein G